MASTFKSHEKPTLSLWETVSLLWTVTDSSRWKWQKSLALNIWPPGPADPPREIQIIAAGYRRILPYASIKQLQFGGPPSGDNYAGWASGAGVETAVTPLNDGADGELLWIGGPYKPGKKVMLYFHGGGFVAPLSPGHLGFGNHVHEESKKEISVAFLHYSLAPGKVFPSPIKQCVAALNHLLDAGCPPSDIILAGDSAGGQMALGVVSHILHPHPDVPPVRELSSPLAGVVAVSPWVTFATTSPSFKENDDSDIISASFINKWGEIAMGGPGKAEAEVAAGRYHAEALQAPESWWTGIGGVTSFLGVTAGKHEVFRDDIVSFVAKVKAEGGKETRIEEFVGARDVHDSLLLEFESGTEPGELTKLAVQWILAAAK